MPGRGWTGGRQIDGAIGSFTALEKITTSSRVQRAQQQGNFTVLFDSGIRKGSDVIKAIAMGAQGVLSEHPFFFSKNTLETNKYSDSFSDASWTAVCIRTCLGRRGGR